MKKRMLAITLAVLVLAAVSTLSLWAFQQSNSESVGTTYVAATLDQPIPETKIITPKPVPVVQKIEEAPKPVPKPKPKKKVVKKAPSVNVDAKPIPSYVDKSLDWLVKAQFSNGAWGAGSHSAQNIKDPKAVAVDPATTAFSAMALLRTGSTLQKGRYKKPLTKAMEFLLTAVEETPEKSNNITTVRGTQPQSKLGQNIDVAMTTQLLARLVEFGEPDAKQEKAINKALDKCISILQNSQQADGSWNTAGWAPVLNSAMANNALEISKKVGRDVDVKALDRSKDYQESNVSTESGTIDAGKAAGVELYAWSSIQRATAEDAREVQVFLDQAIEEETVKLTDEEAASLSFTTTSSPTAPPPPPPPPAVVEEILIKKAELSPEEAKEAAEVYVKNRVAARAMKDDAVLSGFGNNGGEEYLSYMMTSEALITSNDTNGWDAWHEKMGGLFEKVQNQDGSWSGHHCITSPVFCTAAVIMTLTADRDLDLLSNK